MLLGRVGCTGWRNVKHTLVSSSIGDTPVLGGTCSYVNESQDLHHPDTSFFTSDTDSDITLLYPAQSFAYKNIARPFNVIKK